MEQYTRTEWTDDELITAFKLNNMEQGIVQASDLASKTNLLSGGTTGQMLVKASDTDMDVEWSDVPSGGIESTAITKIVTMTQAEYDALETKDATTLYLLKEEEA